VIVPSKTGVDAFDVADGRLVWTQTGVSPAPIASPTAHESLVIDASAARSGTGVVGMDGSRVEWLADEVVKDVSSPSYTGGGHSLSTASALSKPLTFVRDGHCGDTGSQALAGRRQSATAPTPTSSLRTGRLLSCSRRRRGHVSFRRISYRSIAVSTAWRPSTADSSFGQTGNCGVISAVGLPEVR
jgi:hypothetical protein